MLSDVELARRELSAAECALVFARDGAVIVRGYGKGIKPLADLTDDESLRPRLSGAALADKVVGRGVALLCVYRGIRAVYAELISQPALDELRRAGIVTEYGQLVPLIMNQTRTGFCPVETLVSRITDPIEAAAAIRKFLQR